MGIGESSRGPPRRPGDGASARVCSSLKSPSKLHAAFLAKHPSLRPYCIVTHLRSQSTERRIRINEALQKVGLDEAMPSLKQRFVTRKFIDPNVERLFRAYFFREISGWFRLSILMPMFATTMMMVFFIARSGCEPGEPCGPGRSPWAATFADFYGDANAIGNELAFAMVALPMATTYVLFGLTCTRWFKPSNYQAFVGLAFFGVIFGFGLPVHIAEMRAPPQRLPGAVHIEAPAECGPELNAIIDREMELIAKRSAGHAAVALLASLGCVICSPDPVVAVVLTIMTSATSIARANYLWIVNAGLPAFSVVVPFHILGFILCTICAYMQSALLRSQFLIHIPAQLAANRRIEQLGREKERLDYERAFALKRQFSGVGAKEGGGAGSRDLSDPGVDKLDRTSRSDPGASRAKDYGLAGGTSLEDVVLGSTDLARLEEGGGGCAGPVGGGAAGESALPMIREGAYVAASGAPTNSAESSRESIRELRESGALAMMIGAARAEMVTAADGGDKGGDGGSVSSSGMVSTSCSELWGAIGGAHAAGPLGIGCSNGDTRAVGANSSAATQGSTPRLPAYPLRAPYFDEAHDGSVTWLCDEAERARYELHVADGKLTNADGQVLGASGPTQTIFILEQVSGTIFLHPAPPQYAGASTPAFRHSSFVAGKPVAAAGEMLIDRGHLKVLSNASGHYEPPPSCLQLVMAALSRMGVGELQNVELELMRPVAGTALSAPPMIE